MLLLTSWRTCLASRPTQREQTQSKKKYPYEAGGIQAQEMDCFAFEWRAISVHFCSIFTWSFAAFSPPLLPLPREIVRNAVEVGGGACVCVCFIRNQTIRECLTNKNGGSRCMRASAAIKIENFPENFLRFSTNDPVRGHP